MLNRFRLPSEWVLYLSFIAFSLMWGWAWVGIRTAMQFYSPGQLALGRYTIASLVLLPFWAWRGARWPAVRHLPIIAIMGVTGFSVYNLCVNQGERTITAGTAALVGAVLPILMALGARYFFKEKLTKIGWLGVFLAFTGVAVTGLGAHGGLQLSSGVLLVLLAMTSGAVYGLLMKRMLAYYKPLELTTWAIWMGTLGLIPFGSGLKGALMQGPHVATLNLVLLGIFPGAICYLLYAFTAARTHMAQVASWIFLLPLISITLGWFLLGEFPSSVALVGGGVTLLGACLVNSKGKIKT